MGVYGELTITEMKLIFTLLSISINDFDIFFETGTYMGHSTSNMSRLFKTIHTFEVVPELIEQAKEYNKGNINIQFHHGDSCELLKNYLEKNKNSVYFLDAHISGTNDTYHNNKEMVPLLSEIDLILSIIDSSSVFIIDDIRLFYNGRDKIRDWENITKQNVLNVFHKHNKQIKKQFEISDRWVILI